MRIDTIAVGFDIDGNDMNEAYTNKGNKDNLLWGEGMFRTAFINLVFYDKVLKVKEK